MNPLKGIIYNCRKATYLADKKMDGRISFKEQIELRIHLMGCDACKLYVAQSAKITEMIKELLKSVPKPGIRLDDDFKTGLQEQIDARINKN